jgi:hypothetical protein
MRTEMPDQLKIFKAIVWQSDDTSPGQRVVVEAFDLNEAREKLEAEYGKGTVFDLHNEEDSKAVR